MDGNWRIDEAKARFKRRSLSCWAEFELKLFFLILLYLDWMDESGFDSAITCATSNLELKQDADEKLNCHDF